MGCSHTIIPASEGHLFACPGSRIGSRVRWIRAKARPPANGGDLATDVIPAAQKAAYRFALAGIGEPRISSRFGDHSSGEMVNERRVFPMKPAPLCTTSVLLDVPDIPSRASAGIAAPNRAIPASLDYASR